MKLTTTDILPRIETLRDKYRLTAGQIAEIQGVNRSQVNRHLTGVYPLTLEDVLAILEIYPDLSAEWLLRGRGREPFPRSTWNIRAQICDDCDTQEPLDMAAALDGVKEILSRVEEQLAEEAAARKEFIAQAKEGQPQS